MIQIIYFDGSVGTGAWGLECGDGSIGTGAWGWDFRDRSMRIQWDKFTIINCAICGTNITKIKWTICISQYPEPWLY